MKHDASQDRIDNPTESPPVTPPVTPIVTPPVPPTESELSLRRARLGEALRRHQRLLVAFSGGVDSAYLLHAALEDLGPGRVLAVTGVSESLARRELDEARALAARLGAAHREIVTRELSDPRYAANPVNRCYFCKSELFDRLRALAESEGFDAVADGTNLDDTRDIRPGRQAARERGIASPLLEAGLTKSDIRELSRRAGLPTWDKPEMPCLSSRVPFGTLVDNAKLRQIEAAEEALRSCGVRGGRVRHHGTLARIELPPEDLPRLADADFRERLESAVRQAGFAFVAVDLRGYRRGSLHESASRAGAATIRVATPPRDATPAPEAPAPRTSGEPAADPSAAQGMNGHTPPNRR